jgi:uracil-DNA glycosylase family 4
MIHPKIIEPNGRANAATESRLRRLYRDIHECERCLTDPGCRMRPDEQRVVRHVVTQAAISPLFIIGQALSPNTQRRSGLPYAYPTGALSQTGRALDQFLHKMGFTIDVAGELPYPYFSDIVQRYPGPAAGGGGDRRPTPREISNCAEWLLAELLIVRPRVIILLGVLPAQYFLRRYGGCERFEWGVAYEVEIANNRATAFAVYHPSYRRRKPDRVDLLYSQVAAKACECLIKEQPSS